MADADKDLKLAIQSSIKAFADGYISGNALALFSTLGYNTERQNSFVKKTYQTFKESFLEGGTRFNEGKAMVNEWKSVDLLFQLSKDEMSDQKSPFDTKKVRWEGEDKETVIETYLFFAIELEKVEYTRTALAQITREVNKVFPMPVMLVFKHGQNITISVINRRIHKKDERKDVLEKVTLIKDISIENTHRAHIEILFDLSFGELKRIHKFTNFVELHNAWQKTLDTKELNKRFYRELSSWYFWAMREVTFPGESLEADHTGVFKQEDRVREHNATNLIRLLTRILFVWFFKEKGLIPYELFDEKYIRENLINGFEPKKKYDFDHKTQGSKYYRAILQNLFFATLNQTVGKREFRKQGQHMNVTNLMRYESYFKDPKGFLELVEDAVPFMNGGLFECLDKPDPNLKGKRGGDVIIYEDGFSDREDNKLCVPDYIFFGISEHADLSEELGDKKQKNVEVKGLINILKSYKFTVTENTPIEEDIALDPELLGRVFENLLASYNPETKTTARKQTGSFYTPREIVNYMVDESIKAYLKQKLETEAGMDAEVAEIGLELLIGYYDRENLFDEKQTAVLIDAVDNCKILDPACGSGAFPMGILHKLVHVLHKLDPENKLWKERQIEKSQAIDDVAIREQLIEDIETAFSNNELDYGRKLYLIENCIYGVDIQPIATQISKLRFFISLIVDQKTDKNKDNFGIRPLPNLETKFVAANTLIGIEKPKQQLNIFDNGAVNELEDKLKDVRHRLFNAKTPTTKRKLREEDQTLREQMGDILIKHGWGNKTAHQLARWDPYDQNAASLFFDPEWMFGITDGFDVVIGNPPYIEFKKLPIEHKSKLVNYKSAKGKYDIYVIFNERSNMLLRSSGILCFIQPTTFLKKDFGSGIREFIKSFYRIKSILDFAGIQVFEGVTNYTGVFIFEKHKSASNYSFFYHQYQNIGSPISVYDFQNSLIDKSSSAIKNYLVVNNSELAKNGWNFQDDLTKKLMEVVLINTKTLGELTESIFQGIASGKDEVFYVNEKTVKEYKIERAILKKLAKGKDIKKYKIDWSGYYVIYPYDNDSKVLSESVLKKEYPNAYNYLEECSELLQGRGYFDNSSKKWYELWNQRSVQNFKKKRIVCPEITDKNNFVITDSFYGNTKTYHIIPADKGQTYCYYLLGLLNSKLLDFIYKKIATPQAGGFYAYKTQFLSKLPIKIISEPKPLSVFANLISELKQHDKDSTFFEHLIDAMVYELYLPEEIKSAGCEILKHLTNLPELKDDWSDEKKLATIEKVYKELSDPSHPVSIAMEKMKTVPEVRIIEGLDK